MKVIKLMRLCHGICILCSFICESDILKLHFINKHLGIKRFVGLKVLSLIIQTICNQGLIFDLCYFFFYRMTKEWEKMEENETDYGHFEHVDLFDCIVIIDIANFFLTLLWL